MGGERHRESKVSCPRKQQNVPGQDPNQKWTTRSGVERTNYEATAPLLYLISRCLAVLTFLDKQHNGRHTP